MFKNIRILVSYACSISDKLTNFNCFYVENFEPCIVLFKTDIRLLAIQLRTTQWTTMFGKTKLIHERNKCRQESNLHLCMADEAADRSATEAVG